MKINEIEIKDNYKNSFVIVTEEIFNLLPTTLNEENKKNVDQSSSMKIKVENHDHFLNLISYIPKDASFILEDGSQKYIVTGDFADKV
jgi:hypothetical protein